MSSLDIPIIGSDANQRIDKFLRKYLPNAPLGIIFKAIRTGKVRVSGKKVAESTKIQEGDTVEFYFTEEEINLFRALEESPHSIQSSNAMLDIGDILYEDAHLLILNKPPGINVHPGDHKTKESSLIELAQDYLGQKYDTLTFKPSLLHRIDRETSGCILIAKDKMSLQLLLLDLQKGRIEKIYHALVIGKAPKPRDTIRLRLLRIQNAQDEAKVQVDVTGQEAITHYQTLKEEIKGKYSLLECRIETGRTHQIRVHLAYLGIPILGDKSYGNKGENAFARNTYGIHRQLLHAYSLDFTHPITKKRLNIEAPYKKDMSSIVNEAII